MHSHSALAEPRAILTAWVRGGEVHCSAKHGSFQVGDQPGPISPVAKMETGLVEQKSCHFLGFEGVR
jgi:hypothetical protein